MNTQNKVFIILIALLGIFTSCTESDEMQVRGEGKTISETVEHTAFTSIDVNADIDIVLSQGKTFEIEVEAQENIIDYVLLENVDNVLTAKMDNSITVRPTEPVTLYIQMPQIRTITSNGTGDITFKDSGFEEIENLTITQRGTGNINCSFAKAKRVIVNCDQRGDVTVSGDLNDIIVTNTSSGLIQYKGNAVNTNIKSTGNGDIIFTGSTKFQDILMKGTGNYFGSEFISQETSITVNGTGFAEIFVVKSLEAWINGNGDIFCYGDPKVDFTSNGNGNLINVEK